MVPFFGSITKVSSKMIGKMDSEFCFLSMGVSLKDSFSAIGVMVLGLMSERMVSELMGIGEITK
jgi:hypothetical protein